MEKRSVDAELQKPVELYQFLTDGTFLLESGEIKVNGKWRWTKDSEIYLQTEGLTVNGKINKFEPGTNAYIRIIELTDKTLRTLERNDGDTWDSGFAEEVNYTAISM